MTVFNQAKNPHDVATRIQTVLRTYFDAKATALEALWGSGTVALPRPASDDIQIGPSAAFNFAGDPVIAIEWDSSVSLNLVGNADEHQVAMVVRAAFFSLADPQGVSQLLSRFGWCMWMTISNNHADSDGTIVNVANMRLTPFTMVDERLEGWGVELRFNALTRFSQLAPFGA